MTQATLTGRYFLRSETRIPVSKATRAALRKELRSGETYDGLIRRILVSGDPKPIENLSQTQQEWIEYEVN